MPAGKLNLATHRLRVLVLGAGMAGLGAARHLHAVGARVTVIEARDRIGGRTFTSQIWPDLPVDLGASWIHGTKGNPITALAAEIGAAWTATSYKRSVNLDEAGRSIDFLVAAARARKMVKAARIWVDDLDQDVSLQTAVEASPKWRALSLPDQRLLRLAINTRIEHEYSGDWSRLSARYFDAGDDFPGDEAVLNRGYGPLVAQLAHGLDIRLGEAVIEVAPITAGVEVTTMRGSHVADHVIVTLPLGVLKSGTVRFREPLVRRRRRAIDGLETGLLNKCWLRFDRIFWPRNVEWAEWLSAVPSTGRPLLVGFNAAAAADRLEALDDRATTASAMEALRAMFGSAIPDPVGVQISRWRQDPYARGAYSYQAVGTTQKDRRALFGPDWEGRLQFAGEATSLDYPATTHGALLTGRAAAIALLK
jgi:monoamine oxidase